MNYYINKIKKDFEFMKFEIELNGTPKVYSCEYCDGGEYETDSGDYDRCDECSGTGTDYEGLQSMFFETLKEMRLENKLIYWDIYHDGSVDFELTFTIATKDVKIVPKISRIFTECFEHYNTRNAGYHIAVLKSGTYPIGLEPELQLDTDKAENFKKEVEKLIPALILLGSNHKKTRGFGFRLPKIDFDKYSFIHIIKDGFEFRFFDPCADNPEKVMDYIKVIASCLKFYSNKKVKNLYKEFELKTDEYPTGSRNSVYKMYKNQNNFDVLKTCLKEIDRKYKITFKPSKKPKHQNPDLWQASKNYSRFIERNQASLKEILPHYKQVMKAHNIKNKIEQELETMMAKEYIELDNEYKNISPAYRDIANTSREEIVKLIKQRYTNEGSSIGMTIKDFMPKKGTILKGGL